MSKRKDRTGIANIFDDQVGSSPQPIRLNRVARSKSSGSPSTYNLLQIVPDPQQPRKLIPTGLLDRLLQGELSPEDVIREIQRDHLPSLGKIISLAQSIAEKGLIQPIRVRPIPEDEFYGTDAKYLIVVGERRWWAHVYLMLEDKLVAGAPAGRIRAELLEGQGNIRSIQWAENYDREDISAVEKARAISLVRDEMEKSHDVNWKDVENELGISKSTRIRLMSVLELTPKAQELVIRHELPERAIRPIVAQLKKKPSLQLPAIKHLVRLRTMDEVGDEQMLELQTLKGFIRDLLAGSAQKAPRKSVAKSEKPFTLWRKESKKTIKWLEKMENTDIGSLTEKQKSELLAEAERIAQLVDSLLAQA